MRIGGRGGEFATGPIELNTGQSAVSTRLLLAMAALRPDRHAIDGHISMRNRPNKALVDALESLGARIAIDQRRPPADHRHRHTAICAARCACPAISPASTSPAC